MTTSSWRCYIICFRNNLSQVSSEVRSNFPCTQGLCTYLQCIHVYKYFSKISSTVLSKVGVEGEKEKERQVDKWLPHSSTGRAEKVKPQEERLCYVRVCCAGSDRPPRRIRWKNKFTKYCMYSCITQELSDRRNSWKTEISAKNCSVFELSMQNFVKLQLLATVFVASSYQKWYKLANRESTMRFLVLSWKSLFLGKWILYR